MQMQPIIETLHQVVFKVTFSYRFNIDDGHVFLLHLENSYETYFITVAADTITQRFRHVVMLHQCDQSLKR